MTNKFQQKLKYWAVRCQYVSISLIAVVVAGCASGIGGGLVTLDKEHFSAPSLWADTPIYSVEHYKNTSHVDLLSMNHDMRIEAEVQRSAFGSIGSTALSNSSRIGTNDYRVGVKDVNITPIQKQIGPNACWAACVQYLVLKRFNVALDQKEIINEIKKHNGVTDQAGSISEIIRALHISGLTLTAKCGTHNIIRTLGHNQPVMLGLQNPNSAIGHTVVVIAARYSFVNQYLAILPPGGNMAFNEFYVLDPLDGEKKIVPATLYENRINFVLSFYSED